MYTEAKKRSSSPSLVLTMTNLPSGSINWTLDVNKEFGLCNMQVPLECSVPCEKKTFPPYSVAQETSSPFSENVSWRQ